MRSVHLTCAAATPTCNDRNARVFLSVVNSFSVMEYLLVGREFFQRVVFGLQVLALTF